MRPFIRPRCAGVDDRLRATAQTFLIHGPIIAAIQALSHQRIAGKIMNKFHLAVGAIGCAAVLVAGCASIAPPVEQMAVSKSAIANAVSAGGNEYAPVEMRTAQEKMDRAKRAMDKEDYEDARRLAEEAQADARLAETKAHSAKATKAASVTQDDIRALREEISRTSK
jgi:hypothetical protein